MYTVEKKFGGFIVKKDDITIGEAVSDKLGDNVKIWKTIGGAKNYVKRMEKLFSEMEESLKKTKRPQ